MGVTYFWILFRVVEIKIEVCSVFKGNDWGVGGYQRANNSTNIGSLVKAVKCFIADLGWI